MELKYRKGTRKQKVKAMTNQIYIKKDSFHNLRESDKS